MSFAKSSRDSSSKGATSGIAEKDLVRILQELIRLHKGTEVRRRSERGKKNGLGFKSSLQRRLDKCARIRVLQAIIFFPFLGFLRRIGYGAKELQC